MFGFYFKVTFNCNISIIDYILGDIRGNIFLTRWPKCNKFSLNVCLCNVSLSREQVPKRDTRKTGVDTSAPCSTLSYRLVLLNVTQWVSNINYLQSTSLLTMRWSPGRCRGCGWPMTGCVTCWSSPRLPAPRPHLRLRSPHSWGAVTGDPHSAALTTAPPASRLPPSTLTPRRRDCGCLQASPSFGRTSTIASPAVSWRLHIVNDDVHVCDN